MMLLSAVDFTNLHQVLYDLYDRMMHLCTDMTDVAKGIAGLAALFYVATRVWQSLARAEPIDVYPLLRPFAIGICIMFFPVMVLDTINGVMSPVVQGTHAILEKQMFNIGEYKNLKAKLEYEQNLHDPERAYLVSDEAFDKKLEGLWPTLGGLDEMINMYVDREVYRIGRDMRYASQGWLEILFEAASLILDTIRTFFLIVLSILGPVAFAISVWDGFQSTLTQWLCRYIAVYLWLPVSDLFSCILAEIQSLMLAKDIAEINTSGILPDGADVMHIIFLLIGIIGYFTVPTVANWIIQVGGMGNYNRNINQAAGKAAGVAGTIAGATMGNGAGRTVGN